MRHEYIVIFSLLQPNFHRMNKMPLRSFRLVCKPCHRKLVENLLHDQGFRFEPEPFSPLACRLLHEPFPLGGSLAARFGYIYIQDRSSMLPPLALAPQAGAACLDMCASPGSKTGLTAQLVGPQGFVLGNEPSRSRLATLRHNLSALNLVQCATTSYSATELPLPQGGVGWQYIVLDPPCSGWGTVEKNPNVTALWQGDKVKPLIALQRALLQRAFALLAPGGRVVYSTCTTNVEENEAQLVFAVQELGFTFVPLQASPGFSFAAPELPQFEGVLRVPTSQEEQGFFVALLEKPLNAPVASLSTEVPLVQGEDAGQENVSAWTKNHRRAQARGKYGKGHSNGVGGKSLGQKAPAPRPEGQEVLREALLGPGISLEGLPQGRLALFNDVVHFLPQQTEALVPPSMIWKGFPLGRFHGGQFAPTPNLRVLMPELETAEQAGDAPVCVETPEALTPLFSGQALVVGAGSKAAGLYYKGLPLCRLRVKGSRAMLPPL